MRIHVPNPPQPQPQPAPAKLTSQVKDNQLIFSDPNNIHTPLSITFHRTLRVPDDGKTYPLPPSLGTFPIYRVSDYADKVPESWKAHGGVFIPIYQREAMWLNFSAESWDPKAIQIAVGKVNAINGQPWSDTLAGSNAIRNIEQSYVVAPRQPWLDGINSGNGKVNQFVAMPLGKGYTVEGQVTGSEDIGGMQISVHCQKIKPVKPASTVRRRGVMMMKKKSSASEECECDEDEMGIGAGGSIKQQIFKDQHGPTFWSQEKMGRIFIHLVNSEHFEKITGQKPPESPISAQTYKQQGFPWFNYWDERAPTVASSSTLSQVKTIKEIDQQHYAWPQQDDSTVTIPSHQVFDLGPTKKLPPGAVQDGFW